jgi:hypothetical protein
MMSNSKNRPFGDVASDLLYRAINHLILVHPLRTTLGLILGAFLEVTTKVFKPAVTQLTWIDLTEITIWHCFIVGIVLLHIPTYIWLAVRPAQFDEATEKALRLISKAKRGGAPADEVGQMYLDLCQRVIDNVVLDREIQAQLKAEAAAAAAQLTQEAGGRPLRSDD